MPARDVFICHAHFDKLTFARPLAAALGRQAVSCWVDEAELQAGDSIIDAVSAGLNEARYVIVLITKTFLCRNWTQRELNAALTREIRTGTPVVIPVLAIPRDDFDGRYPLLADKLTLDWADGPDTVAAAIAARFGRVAAPEWYHAHPADYIGPIWTRIVPVRSEPHSVTLRWGPYITHLNLAGTGQPVSLIHHKTGADSIILHVSVSPEALVTFGQGGSPDPSGVNIDEGWTRTAGGEWPRRS